MFPHHVRLVFVTVALLVARLGAAVIVETSQGHGVQTAHLKVLSLRLCAFLCVYNHFTVFFFFFIASRPAL